VTVGDVVAMRHFLSKKPRVGTDLPPDLSVTHTEQGVHGE